MHFIFLFFKQFLWLLILIPILSGLASQTALAENHLRVESLPKVVKQGEVYSVRAFGLRSLQSIHVEFQGIRIPMAFNEEKGAYEGLLGIDMTAAPAIYPIKIVSTDEGGVVQVSPFSLKVEEVDFGVQTLSLPSSMVDLDKKTLERIDQEAKRLTALFQVFRDERLWRGDFIRPVAGELTGAFGLRRIINEKPRSQHTGIDLEAQEGTPVLASHCGMIVLTDEFFFSGKSVIVDHGWGLFSMYFHLSEIQVKEGDKVNQGAVLGRVGSTGRSTNPHLHWGIRLNGARVNPLSLPGVTKTLEKIP